MLTAIWRISEPIPGMLVLIWMQFSLWFQIWPWNFTILTFLTILWHFWTVVCSRLSHANIKTQDGTRFVCLAAIFTVIKSIRKSRDESKWPLTTTGKWTLKSGRRLFFFFFFLPNDFWPDGHLAIFQTKKKRGCPMLKQNFVQNEAFRSPCDNVAAISWKRKFTTDSVLSFNK